MKTITTIMKASLFETSTNSGKYHYNEYDEAECGREWGGDVSGYVDNYIDVVREMNGVKLHVDDGATVIGLRGGAFEGIVISDDDGTPREIFWRGEVEDEEG